MKFFNLLILFVLSLTLSYSRVIKDKEYIDKLYQLNLSNNSNNLFSNIRDTFNSLSSNLVNWIYSVSNFYQASSNELNYIQSRDNVTVSEYNNYYFFDGPGKDKALIFYQGAKVDEKAYADIMFNLAENGIDCFLVKMPLRIPIFGKDKAGSIIKKYKKDYKKWYIGGHSFGGAIASMYVAGHHKDFDGLVLLASYSTKAIPSHIKVVTFVATNDKVINWDNYKSNLSNLPKSYTEIKIKGGNHAQFGDYGKQNGDGEATISVKQQHKIVIKTILDTY